jgi:hypothetical protein
VCASLDVAEFRFAQYRDILDLVKVQYSVFEWCQNGQAISYTPTS